MPNTTLLVEFCAMLTIKKHRRLYSLENKLQSCNLPCNMSQRFKSGEKSYPPVETKAQDLRAGQHVPLLPVSTIESVLRYLISVESPLSPCTLPTAGTTSRSVI